MKTPLIPAGFSGKYPTKSGALLMPGMKGTLHYITLLLYNRSTGLLSLKGSLFLGGGVGLLNFGENFAFYYWLTLAIK